MQDAVIAILLRTLMRALMKRFREFSHFGQDVGCHTANLRSRSTALAPPRLYCQRGTGQRSLVTALGSACHFATSNGDYDQTLVNHKMLQCIYINLLLFVSLNSLLFLHYNYENDNRPYFERWFKTSMTSDWVRKSNAINLIDYRTQSNTSN